MYRISKTFRFEAAHRLNGLPPGHKCGQLHGHSYQAQLVLIAPALDSNGFVIDFAELEPFKQFIQTHLDHRMLNDLVDQPTSENLARHLYLWAYDYLPLPAGVTIDCVRISETESTWAEYSAAGTDHQ